MVYPLEVWFAQWILDLIDGVVEDIVEAGDIAAAVQKALTQM